jgi:hypothetical protein
MHYMISIVRTGFSFRPGSFIPLPGPQNMKNVLMMISNLKRNNFHQDEDQRSAFGYQQTLMYGQYSKALGQQLKEEAKKIKQLEKQRKEEYRRQRKELR